MTQSVGAVALDIVMGKNTVTGVVKSAMSECQKVISDSSASMASKVGAIGNAMQGVGKALMPVSAAATAGGVAIGKMAMAFEDAMAKVSTIADTTEIPMADLKQQILDLSDQTGISSAIIADNVYNAISAGQKTGDAVNFVSNSTKLAKAGFADAGASLDILTTILNSYGMEAEEVTKVSDVLIQTQNKGKTTVAELSAYMGKVIPTANAYGVSLENVAANYAIMTAKGIATAESTTYMNSMFNELGKSGTGVSDLLKEVSGKSFKELMDSGMSVGDVLGLLKDKCDETGTQFTDLWSSAEAGKAALVLTQEGAAGFNEMLGTMQNSTGSTDAAFSKMETSSYTMQKTFNTLKNTAIDLGNTLMATIGPILEQLSQKVADFCQWFKTLDDGTKQMIVKIGMAVAAAGPLLIAGGKVITSISGIMNAGKALKGGIVALKGAIAGIGAPVLAIAAVVAVLVAAFTHLWKTNEEFRNNIIAIWDGIKAKFEEFGQGIVDRLNALGFNFESFSEVITTIWDNLCNFLAPVFEGAFEIISVSLGTALDVLTGLFDFFAGLFTGNWEQCWTGIKEIFKGIWDNITGILKAAFDILKNSTDVVLGWFGTSWNEVWTSVSTFFTNIWNGITTFFTNIWNNIITFFTGTGETVSTWWTDLWTGISNFFTDIWNNIVTFFTDIITNIVIFVQTHFGEFFDNLSIVFNNIKELFVNIWEGIKTFFLGIVLLICDIVTGDFDTLKTDFNNIMTKMSEIFTNIWNGIKETAVSVGNAISSYFSGLWSATKEIFVAIWVSITEFLATKWSEIKTTATTRFNEIKTTITTVWTAIKTFLANLIPNIISGVIKGFTAMKTGIVNTVSGIKNAIINGFTAAISWIKELPGQAIQWGKDMIQGIVDGITSMAAKVANAVKGIADRIRSFLHFSVPDEGPLTDYETWMPDFMAGLANGIEKNKYRVIDAVKDVTGGMNIGAVITPPTLKNTTDANTSTSNSKIDNLLEQIMLFLQQPQQFTVPVYLGADLLDEQTVKANKVRALRSGGRA